MKRFGVFSIGIILIFLILIGTLTGCGNASTTSFESKPSTDDVKISYMADFYDNYGKQWLSIEGTSFDIQPNKVKEYYYSSDGTWTSGWTTSSVMSIDINGKDIETCGSTVIFYDNRLEKIETEIPTDITINTDNSYTVNSPDGLNLDSFWNLHWWWVTSMQDNREVDARAVIIQSQNGDPICMFTGDEVSWSVSESLPKTTIVMIDNMPVYIHRANFAIVDLSIFE